MFLFALGVAAGIIITAILSVRLFLRKFARLDRRVSFTNEQIIAANEDLGRLNRELLAEKESLLVDSALMRERVDELFAISDQLGKEAKTITKENVAMRVFLLGQGYKVQFVPTVDGGLALLADKSGEISSLELPASTFDVQQN